jgi:uncharacterized integral membrane protein (TIGR00698 family)
MMKLFRITTPAGSLPVFFLICAILLLTLAPPVWGLFAGIIFSVFFAPPPRWALEIHKPLLKWAIVGLGFGLNVHDVIQTGSSGVLITGMSIAVTLTLGAFLARWMKVTQKTGWLIGCGTAICGGSAIAAVSPVIRAKREETGVALIAVFVLNAVALLCFPRVGRWLGISAEQFAWWSAMAIHDTSAVVGAAAEFSDRSLMLATTIKLTRALWIIPVAWVTAWYLRSDSRSVVFPYFVLLFLGASLLGSYVTWVASIAPWVTMMSKSLFTVALFLIGAGIKKESLLALGVRPLVQATILWLLVCVGSLLAVLMAL